MTSQIKDKNVLHVTNWYPNHWNPREALFIKEHFDAVSDNSSHQLWHVQVRNEGAFFRFYQGQSGECENYLIVDTRIQVWRLRELVSFFLLLYLRIKLGFRFWDAVCVHIAYPLLRFPRLFRFLFGRQLILSEHWSAFRQNFNLYEGSRAKQRIQNIFRHNIPVIAVSQSLMNDIIRFAGTDTFPQYVIPNVIDPNLFCPGPANSDDQNLSFLMVGAWTPIKRPLLIMKAFSKILKTHPNSRLRIVGYGHQWADMKAFVYENDLESKIILLGAMNKEGIAAEMQQASVLLHASDYETFSVVCAEALCSGTPVIASNVGGIPEFVNESNGILVDNTVEAWSEAMSDFMENNKMWDGDLISRESTQKFSPEVVGAKITEVVDRVCKGQG